MQYKDLQEPVAPAPTEIGGNWWKSVEIGGNRQKSAEIGGK
jgi:hypothetical protein